MKLIKKIAAVMFAFMMVFSLGTNVKAESGTSTDTKGSITITNAIKDQDYKIYKILDLESFDSTKGAEAYSYKLTNDKWKNFFETGTGKDYVDIKAGYVTWRSGVNEADAANLAKAAIAYAKDANNGVAAVTVTPTKQDNGNKTETLTYSDLELGYYLVESSVGALCGLTTTNSKVDIIEKNGVPSVEKNVSDTPDGNFAKDSFANIGDKVYFKTVITAKQGAQNYVLHDKMDGAFTFNDDIVIKSNNTKVDKANYTIYYDDSIVNAENRVSDKCTFEIKFTQAYLDTLIKDQQIVVTYSAMLNNNAVINDVNYNKTQLSYGDNKVSNEDSTSTSTSSIKVLKYTGNTTHTLNGAKFKLFTKETGGDALKFEKIDDQNYRLTQNVTGNDEIETVKEGQFTMQGLKPNVTYWLEETEAPKGYNKLTKRIKVELKEYGHVVVDGKGNGFPPLTQVEVENKTGSILPSTGGMGTTLIYLIGGALVLGSGFVLINKKRAKAK